VITLKFDKPKPLKQCTDGKKAKNLKINILLSYIDAKISIFAKGTDKNLKTWRLLSKIIKRFLIGQFLNSHQSLL
jgi:hypothetical protein